MLGNSSNSTLGILIFAFVAIIALIISCSLFERVRIVCVTLIGIILAGSAIYSSVQLNTYYSAEGGIYGHINSLIGSNVAVKKDDLTRDLSNISFSPTLNEGEYSAVFYLDEVLVLDENVEDYMVYINGVPCSTSMVDFDHISAEYTYVYYDYDNAEIIKDTLDFKISLFKDLSVIYVSTYGGLDAVEYWNSYISNNGLELSIKPADRSYIPPISDKVETVLVKLMVEGNLYELYRLPKGSTFTIPRVIENGYEYSYWFNATYTKLYDESIILDDDITLYSKEYFSVKFYVDDTLVKTESYHYLDAIDYVPETSGGADYVSYSRRTFTHWEDIDGNKVTICTNDISLYAVFEITSGGGGILV